MTKSALLLLFCVRLAAQVCPVSGTGVSIYGAGSPGPGTSANGTLLGPGVTWSAPAGASTSTFRQDISGMAVDPHSSSWLTQMGHSVNPGNSVFTTDISFGPGNPWEGSIVHYVHGKVQQRRPVRDNVSPRNTDPFSSDPGTWPLPDKPRIATWYGAYSRPWDAALLDTYAGVQTDQTMFVVDVDQCVAYEGDECYDDGSNISCNTYAAFNLLGGDLQRPYNITSGSSVSGMARIFGMLRADEWQAAVNAGTTIGHALGVTANAGQFTGAATGAASYAQCCNNWSTHSQLIPFGARIRLAASYTPPGGTYKPECIVLLNTLKKYGWIVYDGGTSGQMYPQTTYNWPDNTCPGATFGNLSINSTNFEVVQAGPIYCRPGNSGCPDGFFPSGSAPAITSFLANGSATPTVAHGSQVTLSWSATGAVDASGIQTLRFISWGVNSAVACNSDTTVPPTNRCKFGPGPINPLFSGDRVIVQAPATAGTWVVHLTTENRFGRTVANLSITVT